MKHLHTSLSILFSCFLLLILNACQKASPDLSLNTKALKINKITNNAFQHVSDITLSSGNKFPCNGLVYINNQEAVVFDTPLDSTTTGMLLDHLEKHNIKVKAIIANHFHRDCIAGLGEFHRRGIPSYANELTIQLAKENGETDIPQNGFPQSLDLEVGQEKIECRYYGEAHTSDNIIGWIPSEKMMFGGCMLKCLDATKGYLGDANIFTWSETISKIKATYSELQHAIPGHGDPGGMELLDYTIDLFKPDTSKPHLFFFHNRFLETHTLDEAHAQHGKVEYQEILSTFKEAGFEVHSKQRSGNVNAREYAEGIVGQIKILLAGGVQPEQITIVGTSKGGYIAQYVSTILANPKVNFIFIGSYQERDLEEIPEIQFCGRILNIYEKTDPYGVSALKRSQSSSLEVTAYQDLELNTGLGHGFLFRAMPEWLEPSIAWGKKEF